MCSGFVRFALFTNKSRVVLYRPTDPFYEYIKNLDTTKDGIKNKIPNINGLKNMTHITVLKI